jgi:hypothetical protein
MTVLPVPLSAGLFAALNARLGVALAGKAADAGASVAASPAGMALFFVFAIGLAALIAGRRKSV